MEISNIIIEKRPRLQCANFFISFTQNFVQQDAVKLNVTQDKLTIKFDDREFLVKLSDYFQLHTKTLSQLIIKKNYVSFRINTNTKNFDSELLHVKEVNGVNNNAFILNYRLKVNTTYKIKCSNCTNVLAEDVSFARILELPSENMEMSEWFCHKHQHEKGTEETCAEEKFFDETIDEKFNSNKFKPGTQDIFYGSYFGLFNMKLFKSVRTKGKLTYCKRCFQFLGELTNLKYKDSIKIWNDTVNFETASLPIETIFFFDNDSLLKNFIFILCKLQHDFTFELFGLPQLFKVIYEATLSDGKKNFLLLQIMDHNLEMLRLAKSTNESTSSNIVLEKCKTVKLLFKFEEDEEQPLVKFWLSNTNVSSVQISPQMFMAAVEYLTKMSSLIPECYRTSYGFVLSYLDM